MNKKAVIANAATWLLVLTALVVSLATVRREFFAGSRSSTAMFPRQSVEKNWSDYATEGHVLGSGETPVTIVEFSDFECPFCAKFELYIDSIRTLGASVRVIYRHYPTSSHKFAVPAVRASECAARDGRFESVHAVLFKNQDSLGVAPWWWFAKEGGVQDSARFHACMADSAPIPALVRDTLAARRLGVRGTPTLLIHDLRLNGLPVFDSLRTYIERAARNMRRD
jgi:protein-disulfide isomerase